MKDQHFVMVPRWVVKWMFGLLATLLTAAIGGAVHQFMVVSDLQSEMRTMRETHKEIVNNLHLMDESLQTQITNLRNDVRELKDGH